MSAFVWIGRSLAPAGQGKHEIHQVSPLPTSLMKNTFLLLFGLLACQALAQKSSSLTTSRPLPAAATVTNLPKEVVLGQPSNIIQGIGSTPDTLEYSAIPNVTVKGKVLPYGYTRLQFVPGGYVVWVYYQIPHTTENAAFYFEGKGDFKGIPPAAPYKIWQITANGYVWSEMGATMKN